MKNEIINQIDSVEQFPAVFAMNPIRIQKQVQKKTRKLINLYIVGDRFVNFVDNKNVLTVSECLKLMHLVSAFESEFFYALHAGQGISDSDDQKIIGFIRQNGLSETFLCGASLFPIARAKKYMTHKHKNENTLISEPLRLSENLYEGYLMIDDNCADLSDHLTGQHIQGAVLLEAARQMTMAVTEKFFISDEVRKNINFISNGTDSKFHAYAFPLEVKMIYEIKKVRGLVKQNSRFNVLVSFFQHDELVAEVTYDFSVLSKEYVHQKEDEAAQLAIRKAIEKGVWDNDSLIAA